MTASAGSQNEAGNYDIIDFRLRKIAVLTNNCSNEDDIRAETVQGDSNMPTNQHDDINDVDKPSRSFHREISSILLTLRIFGLFPSMDCAITSLCLRRFQGSPESSYEQSNFDKSQNATKISLHEGECNDEYRRTKFSPMVQTSSCDRLNSTFDSSSNAIIEKAGDSVRSTWFTKQFLLFGRASSAVLWIFSGILLIGNSTLFCFNAYVMNIFRRNLGMMHIDTMTQILVGLKPLQTSLNLAIFLAGIRSHKTLLSSLSVTHQLFQTNFDGPSLNYRRYRRLIIGLSAAAGAVPFTLRAGQYVLEQEKVGRLLLADLSLFFIPIVTIIQVLPLLYFVLIHHLIRFWLDALNRALRRDLRLETHKIDYYFSHYLKLCGTLRQTGSFFNPFIFFSLAMSVVTICLTIYFIVNAQESVKFPAEVGSKEYWVIVFLPVWAGFQIVTSVLYMVSVLFTGITTNEKARAILQTALLLVPRDEVSRFQLVSGILTYTFILIKLQKDTEDDRNPTILSDQMRELIFNGTFT